MNSPEKNNELLIKFGVFIGVENIIFLHTHIQIRKAMYQNEIRRTF
jgi:hypothetical protein